ncbi:MAG: hypothetical protein JSS29_18360 [Proteobacteria bacterium]|nr:hypothetical protein [Pseudomonadota bacterium]
MHDLVFPLAILCLFLAAGLVVQARNARRLKRERFIRQYVFPEALLQSLAKLHPQLTEKDYFLVARALREFFLVRARAGRRLIGMPSRVVDDLWHEFILDTRAYQRFCGGAFGGFFHHVPAAMTPRGQAIDTAMRVTFRFACLEENINPQRPTRLPLLFAIDEKLAVTGGTRYLTHELAAAARRAPDAAASGSDCAATACGGTAGDSSGSGSGGHSCGGHSCGGHGCGGGCGGGGD